MIILFLDFDGVLHPVSGCPPFKASCMEVLSSILDKYSDVRVVITSSWREEKSLSDLQHLLGNDIGQKILGVTPVIDEPFLHNIRYLEVQEYLHLNSYKNYPWFAIEDELGNYPDSAPVWFTDRH